MGLEWCVKEEARSSIELMYAAVSLERFDLRICKVSAWHCRSSRKKGDASCFQPDGGWWELSWSNYEGGFTLYVL